jgi:hypothetical protein
MATVDEDDIVNYDSDLDENNQETTGKSGDGKEIKK